MKHYENVPVLVTGGVGFVGIHLVERLLDAGAQVTVLDGRSERRAKNIKALEGRAEFVEFDFLKDDFAPILGKTKFHTVFHLAANASVTMSVEDPANDFRKNIQTTFYLLEALRQHAPETALVFSSSVTVYGEPIKNPIAEEDRCLPAAPYGVSKLACEHYVRLYAELYKLRAGIARLFSIYGPGQHKLVVYDLMRKLRDNPNELAIFGDGTEVRDLNHVGNAVDALMTIGAKAPLNGECYNAASGETVTIGDLAKTLCKEMGLDPEFKYSGSVRAGETQGWYPDLSRLEALGYRSRISFAEGIADTVAWFKRSEM